MSAQTENAPKKVLVTGANGFVGRHLCEHLLQRGFEVWGIGRRPTGLFSEKGFFYASCDLSCEGQIDALVKQKSFDYVVHLAAQSDVGASWTDPMGTLLANFITAARLLEALRNHSGTVRKVLLIGSAYEYDASVNTALTEVCPSRPQSPYGWSKLLQSALGRMYAELYGLPVLLVRIFNLVGPGLKAGLVARLARELVHAEQAGPQSERARTVEITTGSLQGKRDFLDVRDAADALSRLLTLQSDPGEMFNLCSGRPVSMESILLRLKGLARSECEFRVSLDPSLLRPHDPAKLYGSHEKLSRRSGWTPHTSLQKSLKDLLNEYRRKEV